MFSVYPDLYVGLLGKKKRGEGLEKEGKIKIDICVQDRATQKI